MQPSNDPGEFASVPVTVGADVEGLLIVTGPGATITGQIVFEQGGPPPPGQGMNSAIRINATPGDPENQMGIPPPPAVTAAPDLTFTMKGMMGEYLLRTGVQGQFLKAVMLGSEDITDTPREFKSGDRVTMVMTSRASTLEGNVTDDKGELVTDAGLVLFSGGQGVVAFELDPHAPRRRPAERPLPAAGPDARPLLHRGAAARASQRSARRGVFEQLSKEATTIVIGEDENRQADLKLTGGGGV
jgi:hypothetical protein